MSSWHSKINNTNQSKSSLAHILRDQNPGEKKKKKVALNSDLLQQQLQTAFTNTQQTDI